MFMRRSRQERSIYMFYVIFCDCVNMLKLEGNSREAYDVLVTCTWGVCKLCTWAGRKHVRKRLSEHWRSTETHCGDIGWGAYEGQNGAKMQLGVEEVWGHSGRQGTVWSVFKSLGGSLISTKCSEGDSWCVWWFGECVFEGCFGIQISVITIRGYGGYGLANGHVMQYKRKPIRFMIGNDVLSI